MSYPSEYEDRIRVVTRYTHPNLDPTKTFDAFLLSEITEDDASLLANLTWNSNEEIKYKTAKESLFSLLKANGCYTKEMRGDFIRAKARAGRPIDILDKTEYPDDYLLIIK